MNSGKDLEGMKERHPQRTGAKSHNALASVALHKFTKQKAPSSNPTFGNSPKPSTKIVSKNGIYLWTKNAAVDLFQGEEHQTRLISVGSRRMKSYRKRVTIAAVKSEYHLQRVGEGKAENRM
jgi:hypothetical protein